MLGFGGIRHPIGVALAGVCVILALLAVPAPVAGTAAPACTGAPAVAVEGPAWTRRPLVTLRVTAPAGVDQLEIANSPDFAGAESRPVSPWCTYGWRLPAGSGDPERTVYVRFPGAADPGAVVATRVWLDREEPVVVRADARWRNRRHGWVLTVRAVDLGAGPAFFETSRRGGTVRRRHEDRATVVTWDRSVIERVRYFDRLGNHTGWVRVRFLH